VRHSPCCTLFLINCFVIEMVLCNLHLKRFDITNGLLFDTFSITVWYKFCRHDHSVLELEMIPTRCCRSRNHFQKIWPAVHFLHIFFCLNRDAFDLKFFVLSINLLVVKRFLRFSRFFMEQNAPQARPIKQNAPQARFFDQVLIGTLSY